MPIHLRKSTYGTYGTVTAYDRNNQTLAGRARHTRKFLLNLIDIEVRDPFRVAGPFIRPAAFKLLLLVLRY